MPKPVDREAFFEECRLALRADPKIMIALSKPGVDGAAKLSAAQRGLQALAPVFEKYFVLDHSPSSIARQTLASITGSPSLSFRRSGPGFVGAGCAMLLVGALAGKVVLAFGATLLIIGVIQLLTTKPVLQATSVDYNVLAALASAPAEANGAAGGTSAAPSKLQNPSVALSTSHEAGWHQERSERLRGLEALISATSKRDAGPTWIPFDTPFRIGSLTLPRGGFFMGTASPDNDCAVDPRLEFSLAKPDWLGKGLPYWPRYAKLSREERGTFLAFLHSPRRAGGVGIGYVFLYFYQLEHYLLRHATAGNVSSEEGRRIIDELRGLLQAYGPKSTSVCKYVPELLGVAYARFPQHVDVEPISGVGWKTPQKIALAAAVERGPLSADWAFTWASSGYPAVNSTAWAAMRSTVRDLFVQRYLAGPLVTRVVKKPRTKLRIAYRWAGFSGSRVDLIETAVPDYSTTDQCLPYQALLQSVCEDLESMRRLQRPDVPAGAALAAAPAEIARKAVTPKLAEWASAQIAAIRAKGPVTRRAQDVASALGWIGTAKFGKREASQVAQAMQAMGIGMEPDPRFGGATPKPDTDLMLFELPVDAARAPSPAYTAAHLMITAAASLGAIDGRADGEMESAIFGITTHFQLSDAERARLSAVVANSVDKPVRPTAVANKVKTLPEPQRHALAAVLVDIALADGQVSPAEIRLLERFYGALSLDPATLHADLHHGSLGAKKFAAKAAATQGSAPAAPAALDTDAIAKKLEETARVQSMLAEIFVDDTPASAAAASAPPSASDDGVHADALRLIIGRDAIDRAEWDGFCEARDLLPDAALEALNEWSLERMGEVLLDGDDPLEVNTYARDQLAPPDHDSTHA